jgi:hypothetical protein
MSCLFPYISYWVPDDVLFIIIVHKFVSYIRVRISRPGQSFQLHHSLTTAATPTVSGELHQQLIPNCCNYHYCANCTVSCLWYQQLVIPTDRDDLYKQLLHQLYQVNYIKSCYPTVPGELY